MTLISYAQNYEDVMLWRCFKNVEEGFWIDVGAAHPTEHSVTRAFYERGWSGINIDPEPQYAEMLRNGRPRDINLQVALGAEAGTATLYRISGTGLSTFDAETAARHADNGFPAAVATTVQVTTLADVCAEHVSGDIHFLKIDAEGAEREILAGANFDLYRPWLILIEATEPLEQRPTLDRFGDLLSAAKYKKCWFDGLNAYYVSEEKEAEIAPRLSVPPNVFDDFMRADHQNALTRWHEAEHALASKQNELEAALAAFADAGRHIAAVQAALDHRTADLTHATRQIELRDSIIAEREKIIADRDIIIAQRERIIAEREKTIAEHERISATQEAEIKLLREQIHLLQSSTSWKITAPLRKAVKLVRRV
jgi:FkbM family methyltransferase